MKWEGYRQSSNVEDRRNDEEDRKAAREQAFEKLRRSFEKKIENKGFRRKPRNSEGLDDD